AAVNALQRIYAPHIQLNALVINDVKFATACFAGAVAGILGLENWLGFALFVASTLFSSAVLYLVNFRGRPNKYVQGGMLEVLNPGQENAASFILAWTLLYGMRVVLVDESRTLKLIATFQGSFTVSDLGSVICQ
ncbi:hypothetical protein OF83DRAFT_1069625, partial [Amylostereum chailletii]